MSNVVGSVTGGSRAEPFSSAIMRNALVAEILERLPALGLPDAWLVAGCLFQTIWNLQSGRSPTEGISDYDVFYFDEDVSFAAEDAAIKRAEAVFADLPVRIDLKNQARVHLWYGERFGAGYPRLRSSRDGVDRFLVACTLVAARRDAAGSFEFYAPDGFDDLFAGVLRPNPQNLRPALFAAKAQSYRARWPWLVIANARG